MFNCVCFLCYHICGEIKLCVIGIHVYYVHTVFCINCRLLYNSSFVAVAAVFFLFYLSLAVDVKMFKLCCVMYSIFYGTCPCVQRI